MQISKRLCRIAEQVENRGTVADIGCDHGFTSIYLIEHQKAEHVIAMDINEGPLKKAEEHIAQAGMQEKIEVRLSDGAEKLEPGEADTLLISGMGGSLICKILEDSKEVTKAARELVLSPQSEIFLVRQLLQKMGFCIDREEMLIDQEKYYVILHAVHGQQSYLREEEYFFGKLLLEKKDPILLEFLRKEIKRLEKVFVHMDTNKLSEHGKEQKIQLEKKKCQIENVLKEWGEV